MLTGNHSEAHSAVSERIPRHTMLSRCKPFRLNQGSHYADRNRSEAHSAVSERIPRHTMLPRFKRAPVFHTRSRRWSTKRLIYSLHLRVRRSQSSSHLRLVGPHFPNSSRLVGTHFPNGTHSLSRDTLPQRLTRLVGTHFSNGSLA